MFRSVNVRFSSRHTYYALQQTLLAVSPFLAIRSAPTAARAHKVQYPVGSIAKEVRTNASNSLMLEQRAHHAVTQHDSRDLEGQQFKCSQSEQE